MYYDVTVIKRIDQFEGVGYMGAEWLAWRSYKSVDHCGLHWG